MLYGRVKGPCRGALRARQGPRRRTCGACIGQARLSPANAEDIFHAKLYIYIYIYIYRFCVSGLAGSPHLARVHRAREAAARLRLDLRRRRRIRVTTASESLENIRVAAASESRQHPSCRIRDGLGRIRVTVPSAPWPHPSHGAGSHPSHGLRKSGPDGLVYSARCIQGAQAVSESRRIRVTAHPSHSASESRLRRVAARSCPHHGCAPRVRSDLCLLPCDVLYYTHAHAHAHTHTHTHARTW